MREIDPLKDPVKLFLPPLVPAATLRTSAIYYVLTRKVHYAVRGRGLASGRAGLTPTPPAARVLSHLIFPEGFGRRDAPLSLPKFKGLAGTASCPCLSNGLLLFFYGICVRKDFRLMLHDHTWESTSIKYLVSRLPWDNAHIQILPSTAWYEWALSTGLTLPQGTSQPIFHEWKNPAWAALVPAPCTQGHTGSLGSATVEGLRCSPCASAWSDPTVTEAVRTGKRSGQSSTKPGANSCYVRAGITHTVLPPGCPAGRVSRFGAVFPPKARAEQSLGTAPCSSCLWAAPAKMCQNVPSLARTRHQWLNAAYEMHPRLFKKKKRLSPPPMSTLIFYYQS